jgi:hypothetical protein
LVTFFGPKVDNISSARLLLRVVSITSKFKKCGLLAHSSRVLWWDNHLSPEHLRVFHFVWHLPFDLFGLGDPASSYATTDIALRVIEACKPHHHDKVETLGGGDFSLEKLNETEGKEQHQVDISSRFAALENLDNDVDINRAWETIRLNINISARENLSYYELKKQRPWFDKR